MNDPEHDPTVEADPLDVADDPPADPTILPFEEWVERVEKSFQFGGLPVPDRDDEWKSMHEDGLTPAEAFAEMTRTD